MLVLHKLLPMIVSPLGLVVGLLLLSVMFRRRTPIVLALGLLLISSLPLTANLIWKNLEADHPYQPIESVEPADAVVVLSGIRGGFIRTENRIIPQWGEATDRFFAGVDLWRAEKAPLIVFTQAKMPWSELPPEGEQLAKRAIAMGIPESRILLTGTVTNTADEAREVRALMDFSGMRRVILITSSFHMPRAETLFRRAGVEVVPYPTDFRSTGVGADWRIFIPSAGGLNKSSEGIREYIGRLYYWIKSQARN